ncbi:caspase family protein [Streptomyces sp. NPDC047971]|uniref:caspase family protein n=1 Tax=Streptomyces sp. NPDC047971 TaxID=3154499 RepID=UPI0033CDB05F
MVRLHELHAMAGWPSVRELEKELSVSHFTIHQLFTQPDLPKATVYAEVVAALARRNPWGDEDEVCDRMSRLWLAAYHYQGMKPSIDLPPADQERLNPGPAAPAEVGEAPAPRRPTPRSVASPDTAERHPDLPRLDTSRAVVVGVGRFRDAQLQNLPGVVPGAEAVGALLTSVGPAFLRSATTEVHDGSRLDVLGAVHDAAEEATDTLLLYYAGHGLLSASGSLMLATGDTVYDRPFTAVDYDGVREAFAMSRARRKALILDCCFSGLAMEGSMGTVAELAAATGTYVLSATSSVRAAIASPTRRYPDFTGVLIDILDRGIEDGPALLDLRTLSHELRHRLASQGSPQPQMTSQGEARLALGLNRASRTTLGPADG